VWQLHILAVISNSILVFDELCRRFLNFVFLMYALWRIVTFIFHALYKYTYIHTYLL